MALCTYHLTFHYKNCVKRLLKNMYYFHALYSLYVFSLAKSVQFILEISLKYRQEPDSGGSLGCRLRGLQST